jgi:hypothetical protein
MTAKPLHDLVGAKGPMQWGEDTEKSFLALKKVLEEATRLAGNERQFKTV